MQHTPQKSACAFFCGFIHCLSWFFLAAAVSADNRVIGTVEMRVDGDAQTWYIVQPPGELPPTAVWLSMGPERAAISIGAYPDRDIRLVEDETTGSPVPAVATPVLVLSVGFAIGADKVRYELPAGPKAGPAALIMQPDWRDYTVMFTMSDAPGEITLDRIEANESGDSSFAGTFSGEYQGRDGSVKRITEGHFTVDGARYFTGRNAR